MADISFTATAIVAGTGAQTQQGTLGESGITQGMALYLKASDNKWYKAHCETSAATAAAQAFALGAGGTNQRIVLLTGGNMTCDNLTAGTVYVLSASGLIAPAADLAGGDYVTVVGVADSATSLQVNFIVSGTQVPE